MKKLLLLLICLTWQMSSTILLGQTFHAIIFANTQNKSIGESVTVDFKRMELEMNTIAKSIGYSLKKYNYYGSTNSFNRENLDKVLTQLNCSPNDVVFFYYSGHGGRAENEKTQFPEMCLFVNDENLNNRSQFYPLHDVYERIKSKNPRLTIVMGDMCNSLIEGLYKSDNSFRGATILSKGTTDVYKNLFLSAKGGLIAASSEPGHTSGCFIFQENGNYYHAGGYMTHSFLSVLQNFVTRNKNVNWESLMNNTIAFTRNLTEDNKDNIGQPSPQVPIYRSEIEVVTSNVATPSLNNVPQQPVPSNDVATNQQDNVAYALSMVANQSVPKLDRIRNIKSAKEHFAGMQTKVQVVGCDNRTIVNTSDIESYLNYLSMATNMDQVVVIDTKRDNSGKITYLRVHELHYQ